MLQALDKGKATKGMGRKFYIGDEKGWGRTARKVLALYEDGRVKQYISAAELAKEINISFKTVHEAIRNKRTLRCGITPVYEEEFLNE
ncbi:winged helix-turn-helix domain-containing protein [Vagococcus entomophilus]|nr:winged helix-turn-helix domain-containing protein [Vagococcus entomophilus]